MKNPTIQFVVVVVVVVFFSLRFLEIHLKARPTESLELDLLGCRENPKKRSGEAVLRGPWNTNEGCNPSWPV